MIRRPEGQGAPPPPPRRSKSYERPQQVSNMSNLHISRDFSFQKICNICFWFELGTKTGCIFKLFWRVWPVWHGRRKQLSGTLDNAFDTSACITLHWRESGWVLRENKGFCHWGSFHLFLYFLRFGDTLLKSKNFSLHKCHIVLLLDSCRSQTTQTLPKLILKVILY